MPLVRKDPTPSSPGAGRRGEPLSALSSASADERWTAARSLAASPEGVHALGQALLSEADPRVREAMFTSLARAGTAQSVAAVLPHLRSDDAGIRAGALDALRAMPAAVQPQLAGLLGDSDADVRLLACEIVRGLPGSAASELLCALLDRESQANVCAAAVEVLSEIGDPSSLPVLARCAARFAHEPFLVFAIRVASDRIRTPPDQRG
jgi:HEAT repeat protein